MTRWIVIYDWHGQISSTRVSGTDEADIRKKWAIYYPRRSKVLVIAPWSERKAAWERLPSLLALAPSEGA